MTTTAVQPIEKFCSEKLIMCKYVNDLGSCRLTACACQLTPMTTNEAIDFLKKSKWTLAPHALGEAKWNEAVDIAVKALSTEAAQGWIPCSERLPKDNKEVLISCEWGVDIGEHSHDGWRSEWINHYDDDNVLAWMPLPEPYKGGE